MGLHSFIISSHVSFKFGEKLSLKDSGPLDFMLVRICIAVRICHDLLCNHTTQTVKVYLLASLQAPSSVLDKIVQPKGW